MSAVQKLARLQEQKLEIQKRMECQPKNPFQLQWRHDDKTFSMYLPAETVDQFNAEKVKLANKLIKLIEKYEKQLIIEVKNELK